MAGIFVSGAVVSYFSLWLGAPLIMTGALVIVRWRGIYNALIYRPLSPRQQMYKDCFRDMAEAPLETIEEIVVEISREL